MRGWMKMKIKNGMVLMGESNRFEPVDMYISEGRICSFGAGQAVSGEEFDAEGLYVIPGFIDTHNHGCVGVEFASEDEDFEKARVWLAGQGITGVAPTVRAMEVEPTVAAERNILREAGKASKGARILGIHLEGPFVSHSRAGAMSPPDIVCGPEALRRMAEGAQGMLKIMTFAPERENAAEVIRTAGELGIKISLGHSDATYETAMRAIETGASRATHTFNAMRPLYHRETGILGAVLTDDRVCCEMICDFVHLDEAAIRIVYRLKGAENITIISDSGYMTGLGDGEYKVGDHEQVRIVKDGVCRTAGGCIAGSCVSMLAGARNLLRMGIPLEEVSLMGSLNPARALGADDQVGSLAEGKAADVVVCDEELNIKAVFVGGKRAAVL